MILDKSSDSADKFYLKEVIRYVLAQFPQKSPPEVTCRLHREKDMTEVLTVYTLVAAMGIKGKQINYLGLKLQINEAKSNMIKLFRHLADELEGSMKVEEEPT